ncbi:MAG: 4-hydroxy-tetrahydrodipicolinate reductase [bacterium]
MIDLAIAGASGRMGQAITRLSGESPDTRISVALEHLGSAAIGQDAGLIAGIDEIGVPVTESVEQRLFDVMVDFTTPDATLEHAKICGQLGKPLMVGTTGLSPEQKLRLKDLSTKVPVILAANTSVGVNLCVALLETASRVIGAVTDIEVIEAHHRHKVDAPSGTALLLGQTVARVLGKSLPDDAVYCREGHTGARPEGSIGFSTIRGGDIAGEHTVMFIGESERLEITHRATDRKIFARGALRAAEWLTTQSAGFYDMQDVLGLR